MSAPLTYAIGDIHGCHNLLAALLEGVRDHADGRAHHLVFLGDYIDRGPDSAAVVATVREMQARSPDTVTCLMGNHEMMLLSAARDRSLTRWWLDNGGGTTLESYGAASPRDLPRDLLEWLATLPTQHEDARRIYVHAGLNPARSRDAQTDHDRLWIREPFLSADHDFGKHVVHGHTPVRTAVPDVRACRTNLDTGAVFGGALSAAAFLDDEDQAVAFLRVEA
jgi:diadenosine tetraphosphatase ApaH/serine/threonine PP2A family protein phosphatase